MKLSEKREKINKLLEDTNLIYGKFWGSKYYGLAYKDGVSDIWSEFYMATNLDDFLIRLEFTNIKEHEQRLWKYELEERRKQEIIALRKSLDEKLEGKPANKVSKI